MWSDSGGPTRRSWNCCTGCRRTPWSAWKRSRISQLRRLLRGCTKTYIQISIFKGKRTLKQAAKTASCHHPECPLRRRQGPGSDDQLPDRGNHRSAKDRASFRLQTCFHASSTTYTSFQQLPTRLNNVRGDAGIFFTGCRNLTVPLNAP